MLLLLGVLGDLVIVAGLWWVLRGFDGSLTLFSQALQQYEPPALQEIRQAIVALDEQVDRLPSKWEEFEQGVARRENRIRQVVSRARKELAERGFSDEALEAETAELLSIHGSGGQGSGLPSVRNGVASVPGGAPRAKSDEEIEAEAYEAALRRKWQR